MTTIEKNVAIALMLGAKEERWYPFNKDTGSSGLYYAMQNQKFFPNGERYCGDSMLKYDIDYNWIFTVIKFIEDLPFNVHINECHCGIEMWEDGIPKEWLNSKFETISVLGGNHFKLTKKEAIFEALYQFSQWIKNQKQ